MDVFFDKIILSVFYKSFTDAQRLSRMYKFKYNFGELKHFDFEKRVRRVILLEYDSYTKITNTEYGPNYFSYLRTFDTVLDTYLPLFNQINTAVFKDNYLIEYKQDTLQGLLNQIETLERKEKIKNIFNKKK